MNLLSLIGLAAGLGFAAGIRLYSTVLLIGLGVRYGLIHPPPEYAHLATLADTRVLAVAAVACLLEFFADKVPWIDSLWDTVHTIVRPLGAAGLVAVGLRADPALEIILALLAGGVAFTGHSSKAATRLAVNHSPEPFSNIALSVAEDALAPLASWFFFSHPLIALGLVGAFVFVFLWLSPKVWRMLRIEWTALASLLSAWLDPDGAPATPAAALDRARERGFSPDARALRCAATRSIPGLKGSIGYLFLEDRRALFVARRHFRWRTWETAFDSFDARRGLMFNPVSIRAGAREFRLDAFKPSAVASIPAVNA
jgi:hypothetical protein